MATNDRAPARRPFDACAHCGTAFEPRVSYPVETREAPGGGLELHSFCDDACRRCWVGDD